MGQDGKLVKWTTVAKLLRDTPQERDVDHESRIAELQRFYADELERNGPYAIPEENYVRTTGDSPFAVTDEQIAEQLASLWANMTRKQSTPTLTFGERNESED